LSALKSFVIGNSALLNDSHTIGLASITLLKPISKSHLSLINLVFLKYIGYNSDLIFSNLKLAKIDFII